jgi:6-phosphogluconolactonase
VKNTSAISKLTIALSTVLLCSCGGSDGAGPHTIGGTVTGLAGSRLVLQTNGLTSGTTIGPAANGSYPNLFGEFFTGATYNITVATQPTTPSQTCIVQNGSGIISGSDIDNVQVVCTTNPGRFLYTPAVAQDAVVGYEIDASSGALATLTGSPFADRARPVGVAVDSGGNFAYVVNTDGTHNGLSVFSIDRGNGALSRASYFDLELEIPRAVAVDPSGKFVFVTTSTACLGTSGCLGHVLGFVAGNGTLKPIDGSPFAGIDRPLSVVFDPLDRFVYVDSVDGVYVLQLNGNSGSVSVTSGSPFAAWVTVATPSGKYLYGARGGLSGYVVDEHSGALTYAGGFPYPSSQTGAETAVVDPSGKFVYALNPYTGKIEVGAIDPTTGALAISAYDSNSPPGSWLGLAAVDPLGQTLYVTNIPQDIAPASGSTAGYGISAFKIDRSTGAVTPVTGSPFTGAGTIGAMAISN